ncbi:class I adenylate-forming enzyme family protein [Sphingomonas asaccharolytica]|uniref:class I adenylate-forming enzyme family protein n=1 Tax=Sphingomonas asaccharolytica TaxID=40681 RepID=UPI000831DB9F|nr:class I adenylate-forming enzyme family protein [Sphingomonas asaccharolytica]
MSAEALLTSDFATLPDIIREHAKERGGKTAVADADGNYTYAELDAMMDRIAAALRRDGVEQGQSVAIISASSIAYAAVFLGTLRAGCVAAPLAPSSTPEALAAMIADCGAPIVFLDGDNQTAIAEQRVAAKQIRLDTAEFAEWLAPPGSKPRPVTIDPADGFNIIYSSGTTGTPKGIVQSHDMRWSHIGRNSASGYGDAVTMNSTPLYSNTTLVSFLPTLGWGGTVFLMKKFDARAFLELAEKHRVTHAMLVPVQYQRIMAVPDFDRFDLSAFRFKTSTSAPFSPALKADILARWPGRLVEFYGMTEGGASTGLDCTAFPDKLHTVGQPLPGHDMRLIDDDGNEVAQGETGEVVGRSPAMMTGYHGRKQATADAEWYDKYGNRFIRHGDIGRFDEDGFLILMDRKKDLIISGGFNIYPVDIEAVLKQHPAVQECTVIGVPSEQWGETPVGFYVPNSGIDASADEIMAWTNNQLGKTQRLSALHPIDELPRSAIGKVLKRELRDRLAVQPA